MSDHDDRNVRGPEERFTPFTREETAQVTKYLRDKWGVSAEAAEAALAQTHKDQDLSMEYIAGLEAALATTRQALRLWAGYYESVKHDPDYDMDGIEWDDIYEQTRALAAIEDSP